MYTAASGISINACNRESRKQISKMACFGALLYVLVLASVSSSIIDHADHPGRIQSEYLVSVRPNVMRGQSLKQRMDLFEQKMAVFSQDILVVARCDFNKLSVLRIKSESEVMVTRLYSFPEVTAIEADVNEFVLDDVEDQCIDQSTKSGLWGLSRIASRENTGDNTYSYKSDDGEGGYVYVIDSGIMTTHVDFGGRAIHGYTHPNIIEEPTDLNGHGTHCAATVIGATYGVAKSARAIAVKILTRLGGSSLTYAIDGLNWLYQDFTSRDAEAGGNFAAVASMSLKYSTSTSIDSILMECYEAGLLTVASAGNSGGSACDQSPARAEAAVAVMASDLNDDLAEFSNYGPCASVIAPGVDILSAGKESEEAARLRTGTSMAAPHVAGVLLKYMTQKIKETGVRPSPNELREWLEASSTKDVINIRDRSDTNNYFLYSPCDSCTL